jgi:hypothetical protein
MSNRIGKLAQRLLKLCDGEEFGCALGALHQATAGILRAIPDDDARAAFIITHIYPFIYLVDHDETKSEPFQRVLKSISDMPKEEKRNAIALGHVNALAAATLNGRNFSQRLSTVKLAIIYMPFEFSKDLLPDD